jgi:hypothetical protein
MVEHSLLPNVRAQGSGGSDLWREMSHKTRGMAYVSFLFSLRDTF